MHQKLPPVRFYHLLRRLSRIMTLAIHWKTHEPFGPLLVMEARHVSFPPRLSIFQLLLAGAAGAQPAGSIVSWAGLAFPAGHRASGLHFLILF
jgi:hypothetical protein